MRPGGRFVYEQDVTTEEMKRREATAKARKRFEANTEALLK